MGRKKKPKLERPFIPNVGMKDIHKYNRDTKARAMRAEGKGWFDPVKVLPEDDQNVWFIVVSADYPERLLGEFWHGGEAGGEFYHEFHGPFSINEVAWWTPLIEPGPPPDKGLTFADLL